MQRLYVVMIESYDGDDTYLHCGNESQNHLFCVVRVDTEGQAEIIDNGYLTYKEALEAWPEVDAEKRKKGEITHNI